MCQEAASPLAFAEFAQLCWFFRPRTGFGSNEERGLHYNTNCVSKMYLTGSATDFQRKPVLAAGRMPSTFELTIKPRSGWEALDFGELWHFHEIFGFLVWRDIKIRYKQTVFGSLWAVLQPLATMLAFTLVLNRMVGVKTGGPPYPLFSYAGLVLWTFFANSVLVSSNSLVGNQALISKVYFPRIFVPLAAIGALIVDLVLGSLLLIPLIMFYKWPLTASASGLPLFVLGAFLGGSGLGLMLSALNVWFRDVKYVVPFCLQLWVFVTPIMYPVSYIPQRYRWVVGVNPMGGMVVGFRHALLGTPVEWGQVGISLAVNCCLFAIGVVVFRRMERRFADIV
jgi:lipopolysaccharide transport system permease protein